MKTIKTAMVEFTYTADKSKGEATIDEVNHYLKTATGWEKSDEPRGYDCHIKLRHNILDKTEQEQDLMNLQMALLCVESSKDLEEVEEVRETIIGVLPPDLMSYVTGVIEKRIQTINDGSTDKVDGESSEQLGKQLSQFAKIHNIEPSGDIPY